MQTFQDQVKMLYREYSAAVMSWRVEKMTMEKKVGCGTMWCIVGYIRSKETGTVQQVPSGIYSFA